MTVLHYLHTLQASMWNLFVGFLMGLQLSILIKGLVMEKLLEFLQLAWYDNITEFCIDNSDFIFCFDMVF